MGARGAGQPYCRNVWKQANMPASFDEKHKRAGVFAESIGGGKTHGKRNSLTDTPYEPMVYEKSEEDVNELQVTIEPPKTF